jgi:hypothetical protein
MTNRTIFRAIAATFIFGSLAACETTTTPMVDTPAPREAAAGAAEATSLTPITSAELFAAFPGAESIPMINGRREGFTLHADNTVTYDAIKSGIQLRTMIVSNEGNRICMEDDGSWSGACFSMYRTPDNRISLRYMFGNNRGGTIVSKPLNL